MGWLVRSRLKASRGVFVSRCALELLRVLRSTAPVRVHAGILPLRGYVCAANADGMEFVLPDVPVNDLFLARRRVENATAR